MTPKALASASLDRLVDHMFEQVLDEEERAALLARIRAWEAANPDVDPAHRVTGWIDLAYALSAERRGKQLAPRAATSSSFRAASVRTA